MVIFSNKVIAFLFMRQCCNYKLPEFNATTLQMTPTLVAIFVAILNTILLGGNCISACFIFEFTIRFSTV